MNIFTALGTVLADTATVVSEASQGAVDTIKVARHGVQLIDKTLDIIDPALSGAQYTTKTFELEQRVEYSKASIKLARKSDQAIEELIKAGLDPVEFGFPNYEPKAIEHTDSIDV